MAQFDFTTTWADTFRILQAVLDVPGIRAYFDMPYERPEPRQILTLAPDTREYLQTWRRVYLFGPFSIHPPLLKQAQGGDYDGRYFLDQSYGGPLLELCLSGEMDDEGQRYLGLADLSTQPYYQFEAGGGWEKPGSALKQAYLDLCKVMKRHLIHHRRAIWIGPEALRMYQAGEAIIGAKGVLAALARAEERARAKGTRSAGSAPPAEPLPRAAAGE